MPTNIATIAPTKRYDALVRTGSRHARQLAATVTLLSVRPALAMPNSPNPIASQRVDPGWFNAVSIWLAIVPVMPASSSSRGPTTFANNPAIPTMNNSIGTKNRNSRKARALPTSEPGISRSRPYTRSPRSTGPRPRWRSNSSVAHSTRLSIRARARPTIETPAGGLEAWSSLGASLPSDPPLTTRRSSAGRRGPVGVRRRGGGLDGLVVGGQFLLLQLVGLLHRALYMGFSWVGSGFAQFAAVDGDGIQHEDVEGDH